MAILTKSCFMIYRIDMFFISIIKSAAKVELFKGLVNRKMYRYIEYCIKMHLWGGWCTKLHGFEILSMLFIFEEVGRYLIFAG